MAKHSKMNKKENEGKETVEFFKELDREAFSMEQFLEKNTNILSIIFGGLIVLVLAYFAYQQFIIKPENEEATKTYLMALNKMETGKKDEALGGKSTNPGFVGTFEKFSSTDAGKLSAYNAALIKFGEAKYQDAYKLMDGFSSDNKILMALKYGMMGDSQANLNKANDALDLLKKASTISNDKFTSYYFTRKAGLLAVALNKKDDAKTLFSDIDTKYKEYDNGMSDVYIEMVKYY